MNYVRIVLAAFAAMVVFFVYGFLVHGLLLAKDYTPYPEGVYRSGEAARSFMPIGLTGIFIAILVFASIYAVGYEAGRGLWNGARLGVMFGIFMAGAFAAVNYATVNISGKLALELAVSEPIEWTLVGIVVALIYKPGIAAGRV
jgi:hypothetical protein